MNTQQSTQPKKFNVNLYGNHVGCVTDTSAKSALTKAAFAYN